MQVLSRTGSALQGRHSMEWLGKASLVKSQQA